MKKLYSRFLSISLAVTFVSIVVFTANAAAKDQWIHVKSPNFNLIGNASEKEIRRAATKLEQFRETFRHLFSKTLLTSPVPTNVIVFKSDSAYKPFKPKRADGKIDNFIAGYFQPGDDVNYITLAADGTDDEMYGTIFHEYVHFILNTNFESERIPAWFNEGLAEYYQTFSIENDQKVILGKIQDDHLAMLQRNKLIPLNDFFALSNFELHQTGNSSRSLYYAQAWAIIHYMISSKKQDQLDNFVNLSHSGLAREEAFKKAFGIDFSAMESELKKYVNQSRFQGASFEFSKKLIFDQDMTVTPLSEAWANAYLGDLLFHTDRADDAEEYLAKAISLEPNLSMANSSMGMVKTRQRKFPEAKGFFEKAISADQKNHIALYQYAFLLSREALDEFGFASSFPAESAAKMREMLKKAVELNPSFTESYELLAFVSLVNNDELDDALKYLRTALQYQPGNEKYMLRAGEIYLRQEKFNDALKIAEKVASSSRDAANKARAEDLRAKIRQGEDFLAQRELAKKQYEEAVKNGARPVLVSRSNGQGLSQAELEELRRSEELFAMNQAIAKNTEGERQIVGRISKIDCKGSNVTYSVEAADGESLKLASDGFSNVLIVDYSLDAKEKFIGCGAELSKLNAVLTFKTAPSIKSGREELLSIDFVPEWFRFLSPEEMEKSTASSEIGFITETQNGPPADLEEQRRKAILQQISNSLRKPIAGETRKMGFMERIECDSKSAIFVFRENGQTIKLRAHASEQILIRSFAPELGNLSFGCGTKAVEFPAVFTFKPAEKVKNQIAGDLVSLEFVPKSFVLEQ